MKTWYLRKIKGQHVIAGRGLLLIFIPKENLIEFDEACPPPFLVGDSVVYNGKEYDIIGLEKLNKPINTDTDEFGFLIKEL